VYAPLLVWKGGCSIQQRRARIFNVRDTTIREWIDRYSEFADAIKKGREIADANVAKAPYRRAIGWTQPAVKIATKIETLPNGTVVKAEHIVPYVEHFPPDTAAAFIWLKNRRPDLWRHAPPTTHPDLPSRGR
jgi:hypothetical protein